MRYKPAAATTMIAMFMETPPRMRLPFSQVSEDRIVNHANLESGVEQERKFFFIQIFKILFEF